jgi:hypothetical protein
VIHLRPRHNRRGPDRVYPQQRALVTQPAWSVRRNSADRPGAKAPARAPDVQASLWVLGRGGFADALGEEQWLDLSAVDLRRANLRNAQLGDVDLRFARLQRAFLAGAHLRGAYLDDSHLEGARLSAADPEGANLDGIYLQGAEADVRTKWPEGFDWRAAGVTVAQST